MVTTDYSRQSIFMSKVHRAAINALIAEHSIQVRNSVIEACDNSNLYLAGSFARGEPSILVEGNGICPKSDLDWIVTYPADGAPLEPLQSLELRLDTRFPRLRDTIYLVREDAVARAATCSGHDLADAMKNPIVQAHPVPPPRPPPLRIHDFLEVVVYQLAAYLLDGHGSGWVVQRAPSVPTYWLRDPAYTAVKLLAGDPARGIAHVRSRRAQLPLHLRVSSPPWSTGLR